MRKRVVLARVKARIAIGIVVLVLGAGIGSSMAEADQTPTDQACQVNLLSHNGATFEGKASTWEARRNARVDVSNAQSLYGSQSLKITPTRNLSTRVISEKIAIQEHHRYRAGMRVYSSRAREFSIAIWYLDAKGTVIAQGDYASRTTTPGQWSPISSTLTAPGGAVKARMNIRTSEGADPLYVDNAWFHIADPNCVSTTTSTTLSTTTTIRPTTTTRPTTTSTTAIPNDCANQAADIVLHPTDSDIAGRIWAAPAGTRFRFAPGIYRNISIRARDNQQFFGSFDQDCRRISVLDGSISLTGFVLDNGKWVLNNTPAYTQPETIRECEPTSPRCNIQNDLFVNNAPIRHVASLAQLTADSWYWDIANRRAYLGSDPHGKSVTLSATPIAFHPTSRGVTISGLRIQKYASEVAKGAIGWSVSGPNWTVSDNEITLNHGAGVVVGANARITNNYVHTNGQVGAKGPDHDVIVSGNIFERNNYAGIFRGYEAGGAKISADDSLIKNNCVANNFGNGIWVDVKSSHVTIENNLVFDNTHAGIHYEISSHGTIRNNVLGRNATVNSWPKANIFISTSSDTNVYGNIVEVAANAGHGIGVVWADRRHNFPGLSSLGNSIYDNDVTYLGNAGVSGMKSSFAPISDALFISGGTVFRNNRYHLPAGSNSRRFAGKTGNTDLAAAQNQQSPLIDQETGSTEDNRVSARTWTCSSFDAVKRSN